MRSRLPSARAVRIATLAAQAQMGSVISVLRPSVPTFNSSTGLMTAHDTTTVVTTQSRIYPVSGGGESLLGSGDTVMRTCTFSVPEVGTEAVRVGDRVKIVSSSDDTALVGREFEIMDVSLGGILDPTRKLVASAIEPNQFWTSA